ncbi:MAG: 23S rRNA (adenine(2503)-C(2))-methyltransferase RlmN [Candidatus Omnitrophica bacterium]|nr:23S rRNA (adenine(2503)-C(2))-methyltransferase RlmN [Candidatus Omnitrophota bacterium]
MKQDIKNLTIEELVNYLSLKGEKTYHAKQIATWIYKKDLYDFTKMTDISLQLREKLISDFYIGKINLTEEKISEIDSTRKFLFQLKDNRLIESVLIPNINRLTACISTQIGCKFGCVFCLSGARGFIRNLCTGEIVNQLQSIIYILKNSNNLQKGILNQRVNNVVFMGMGEPLDNYKNVIKAIKIINHPYGLNIGARKITISTCGLPEEIKKLSQENIQVELSISLHAPTDSLRNRLMPINKKFSLKELIPICRKYSLDTKRIVTFEYVLIKDVNDSRENLEELIKLLQGFKWKVNLIIYNPSRKMKFQPSSMERAILFQKGLKIAGIIATIRQSKGEDIGAACGQLALRI